MIASSVLKQHLGLERRSVSEIATVISVIAVVGATLYNLGFFAPIEWSLISLLTVQDLLTGAVVALFPMGTAAWAAWLVGRLIQAAPSVRLHAVLIGLPILILSGVGFFYFFDGPGQSTIGHLACGYVLIGVGATGANLIRRMQWLPLTWLGFSLVYIPMSIGVADSLASSAPGGAFSEIETDREILSGRVVRMTSAYLLIADDNAIVTIPMNKVREIKRVYVHSPEADFLTGPVTAEQMDERALRDKPNESGSSI